MKMLNYLVNEFIDGNENQYETGKEVSYLFEDCNYNDDNNYDDEDINNWNELKNKLKVNNIVFEKYNRSFNFELIDNDILMTYIEI